MIVITYILPFITALVLLFIFHKKMVWWEYLVLILPSLLIVFISQLIMVACNSVDTEYLGGYVTKITYYEEWDEMVLRTKTRRVPCGTDSQGHIKYRTETYTVWERVYHPEKWTYTDNENDESRINKKRYELIKKRLNSPLVFRDMKRRYHRIDGDAYDTYWNNNPYTLYDLTYKHKYKNKIKSHQSNTIFRYMDINEDDAKEMGLYEYPEIADMSQNPIIGRDVPDKDKQRIQYINAIYGKSKQFRMYILLYENKDIEISELQKSYWQNGNKNEFIVCLGMKADSVVWSNSFSWCDEPKLEVLTRDYFIQNPKLNIDEYGKWLEKQIPNNWTRKQFEDFDYISINVSNTQEVCLLIMMIVFCVGISIFLVLNDTEN